MMKQTSDNSKSNYNGSSFMTPKRVTARKLTCYTPTTIELNRTIQQILTENTPSATISGADTFLSIDQIHAMVLRRHETWKIPQRRTAKLIKQMQRTMAAENRAKVVGNHIVLEEGNVSLSSLLAGSNTHVSTPPASPQPRRLHFSPPGFWSSQRDGSSASVDSGEANDEGSVSSRGSLRNLFTQRQRSNKMSGVSTLVDDEDTMSGSRGSTAVRRLFQRGNTKPAGDNIKMSSVSNGSARSSGKRCAKDVPNVVTPLTSLSTVRTPFLSPQAFAAVASRGTNTSSWAEVGSKSELGRSSFNNAFHAVDATPRFRSDETFNDSASLAAERQTNIARDGMTKGISFLSSQALAAVAHPSPPASCAAITPKCGKDARLAEPPQLQNIASHITTEDSFPRSAVMGYTALTQPITSDQDELFFDANEDAEKALEIFSQITVREEAKFCSYDVQSLNTVSTSTAGQEEEKSSLEGVKSVVDLTTSAANGNDEKSSTGDIKSVEDVSTSAAVREEGNSSSDEVKSVEVRATPAAAREEEKPSADEVKPVVDLSICSADRDEEKSSSDDVKPVVDLSTCSASREQEKSLSHHVKSLEDVSTCPADREEEKSSSHHVKSLEDVSTCPADRDEEKSSLDDVKPVVLSACSASREEEKSSSHHVKSLEDVATCSADRDEKKSSSDVVRSLGVVSLSGANDENSKSEVVSVSSDGVSSRINNAYASKPTCEDVPTGGTDSKDCTPEYCESAACICEMAKPNEMKSDGMQTVLVEFDDHGDVDHPTSTNHSSAGLVFSFLATVAKQVLFPSFDDDSYVQYDGHNKNDDHADAIESAYDKDSDQDVGTTNRADDECKNKLTVDQPFCKTHGTPSTSSEFSTDGSTTSESTFPDEYDETTAVTDRGLTESSAELSTARPALRIDEEHNAAAEENSGAVEENSGAVEVNSYPSNESMAAIDFGLQDTLDEPKEATTTIKAGEGQIGLVEENELVSVRALAAETEERSTACTSLLVDEGQNQAIDENDVATAATIAAANEKPTTASATMVTDNEQNEAIEENSVAAATSMALETEELTIASSPLLMDNELNKATEAIETIDENDVATAATIAEANEKLTTASATMVADKEQNEAIEENSVATATSTALETEELTIARSPLLMDYELNKATEAIETIDENDVATAATIPAATDELTTASATMVADKEQNRAIEENSVATATSMALETKELTIAFCPLLMDNELSKATEAIETIDENDVATAATIASATEELTTASATMVADKEQNQAVGENSVSTATSFALKTKELTIAWSSLLMDNEVNKATEAIEPIEANDVATAATIAATSEVLTTAKTIMEEDKEQNEADEENEAANVSPLGAETEELTTACIPLEVDEEHSEENEVARAASINASEDLTTACTTVELVKEIDEAVVEGNVVSPAATLTAVTEDRDDEKPDGSSITGTIAVKDEEANAGVKTHDGIAESDETATETTVAVDIIATATPHPIFNKPPSKEHIRSAAADPSEDKMISISHDESLSGEVKVNEEHQPESTEHIREYDEVQDQSKAVLHMTICSSVNQVTESIKLFPSDPTDSSINDYTTSVYNVNIESNVDDFPAQEKDHVIDIAFTSLLADQIRAESEGEEEFTKAAEIDNLSHNLSHQGGNNRDTMTMTGGVAGDARGNGDVAMEVVNTTMDSHDDSPTAIHPTSGASTTVLHEEDCSNKVEHDCNTKHVEWSVLPPEEYLLSSQQTKFSDDVASQLDKRCLSLPVELPLEINDESAPKLVDTLLRESNEGYVITLPAKGCEDVGDGDESLTISHGSSQGSDDDLDGDNDDDTEEKAGSTDTDTSIDEETSSFLRVDERTISSGFTRTSNASTLEVDDHQFESTKVGCSSSAATTGSITSQSKDVLNPSSRQLGGARVLLLSVIVSAAVLMGLQGCHMSSKNINYEGLKLLEQTEMPAFSTSEVVSVEEESNKRNGRRPNWLSHMSSTISSALPQQHKLLQRQHSWGGTVAMTKRSNS
ncbi:hypothetical protein ACA910_005389 [Epithemia clementina (nom. ined.)]